MKVMQWKTYRTRFLVKAKQLDSSLSFTDHLGRQHCGQKGDYLVESFEGVISIAPRRIFEDIYVQIGVPGAEDFADAAAENSLPVSVFSAAPLDVPQMKRESAPYHDLRRPQQDGSPRARRKSPQPVGSSLSRVGLM